MTHNRMVQWIAVGFATLSLLAAGWVIPYVNQERHRLQLTVETIDPQESGVPPHIMLLVAASGTFRGLAANYLWMRANDMKQEGKYYEAHTLAEIITRLQPRFPQVWVFQAWNMAYNISVATHTPAERWEWVNKGIDLLRNDAIPLNPNSPLLYKELSWIFFHKIGYKLDDMHWHYRAELARDFQEFLTDPTNDGTVEEVIRRFRRIVEAPDTLHEVLAGDPHAAALVRKMHELRVEPSPQLARMFGRIIMYNYSIEGHITGRTMPPDTHVELYQLVRSNPEFRRALFQSLMPYWQKRLLIDQYRMDPQVMLQLMQEYGPLDWRHPASHGIYWAHLGVEAADRLRDSEDTDELNILRQRINSLQKLTEEGRIAYDPVTHRVDIIADPRFIPAYEKAVEAAWVRIENQEGISLAGGGKAERRHFAEGHENFLCRATVYSYLYGQMDQAVAYYDKLRQHYGENSVHNQAWKYQGSLQNFVITELDQTQEQAQDQRQFIDAMIVQAVEKGLFHRRYDVFGRFLELAQIQHERRQQRISTASPTARQNRDDFLPFPEVVANSYEQYMKISPRAILDKARIWAATPEALKQMTYLELRSVLMDQAARAGFDPQRAFPAPEGVQEIVEQKRDAVERIDDIIEEQRQGLETIERK